MAKLGLDIAGCTSKLTVARDALVEAEVALVNAERNMGPKVPPRGGMPAPLIQAWRRRILVVRLLHNEVAHLGDYKYRLELEQKHSGGGE